MRPDGADAIDVPTEPARVRRSRPGPFEQFFALNHARTVRLVHLLTGSTAAAEDLTQDAFAQIHQRFDSLNNPAGYLHVVTVNACRRWHTRNYRAAALLPILAVPDPPAHLEPVLDVIDGLPFRQRAVLVLRYWLDLPEAEIAAALDCRPGTVRSLHFRALAALRKELG